MLIEPATVNEARLFSLESRVVEEEEMRIKEYEYMRDMFKKLVYSLEQVNMTAIDKKGMMKSPEDEKQYTMLPNLLIPNQRDELKAKS